MTVPTTTPWLPYYGDRFIKETFFLNPIEVATYYRFFESYSQKGHLPDDIYLLQEIARLDSALTVFRALMGDTKHNRETWELIREGSINKVLGSFFQLGEDGNYHHAGWDKEINKAGKKYANGMKRVAVMNERRSGGPGAASDDAGDGGEESLAG